MAEEELRPMLDPSALREPADRPPVVGFFPRAGAFLIDCFLLWFLVSALGTYAFETLYPNRIAWQLIVALGVFAYFWAGSMPVTGGRTVGKSILKLRVTGLDGTPLTPGRAALRAAMVSVMVLVWSLWRGHLWFPEMNYSHAVGWLAVGMAATSYALATSIVTGQHPRKRGLHDMASGSCVLSDVDTRAAIEYLNTWDDGDRLRLRNAFLATGVTILILVGFGIRMFMNSQPVLRERLEQVEVASRLLDVEGFHVVYVGGPSAELENAVQKRLADERVQLAEQKAQEAQEQLATIARSDATSASLEKLSAITTLTAIDDITTRVLEPLDVSGRELLLVFDVDTFCTSETLITDPKYQELRANMPEVARELCARYYTDKTGEPYPCERVLYQLVGTLPLYLTGQRRPIHRDYIDLEAPVAGR